MYNTLIGEFCASYDDWQALLTAEPYFLKIKEDDGYIIFNYDQLASDFSIPIVREARGIIFKRDNWKHPVCWGFNKFGNVGEGYVPDIDWSTAFVNEKIDGSLIKIWWDWSGGWHISTNGTIDAYKAELNDVKMPNFGIYFEKALEKYFSSFDDFVEDLNNDLTYMFELVGPFNRVVIPYDEPDLYFLGARNKFTGEEFLPTALNMENLGVLAFRRPAVYSLSSLDDCLKAAELKSWDDEGFVVCDKDFNRAKIKSPAYVMAHFMRNNNVITKRRLIRIILMNEVAEFMCYASEYKDALLECQNLMNGYFKLGDSFITSVRKARSMSRRDFAELVKTFPSIFQGALFLNYDRDISMKEFTSNWSEYKWEEYLERVKSFKNEYFK